MDFYKILKGGVGVGMNNFDRLFAEKYGGGAWQITTLTGTLPMSFKSKGEALTDYQIYGTADGAGVETENLFDCDTTWESPFNTSVTPDSKKNSFIVSGHYYAKCLVDVNENTDYIMSYDTELVTEGGRQQVLVYSENMETIISAIPRNSFNTGSNSKVWILFYCNTSATISDTVRYINTMLNEGSTALPYEPYGYQLPMTMTSGEQSQDYTLYIGDSKLGAEEYVDYESGKIYRTVGGVLTPTDPPVSFPEISTYAEENTLSCSETLGEVSITGYIKGV